MKSFTSSNSQLEYHHLKIYLKATTDTYFNAWIGAIIRNNLLYAAEQIKLPNKDISLFEFCQLFPLKNNHPLYKGIKEGFPSPYYLFISDKQNPLQLRAIYRNETLIFSLILIGSISQHFTSFIDAIRLMCEKGFGMHSKIFTLVSVHEVSIINELHLLADTTVNISNKLVYPILYDTIIRKQQSESGNDSLRIIFESPVCLIKSKQQLSQIGYQEKCNAFPSFYQLIRTAAHRLEKLNTLYADPDNYLISHPKIESYIEQAAQVQLERVDIQRIHLMSSQRKYKSENRIPLTGFIGEMVVSGRYKPYLPLLKFMELLGVGHELAYGFGKIRVE